MILRRGDMWTESKATLKLFTGNSTVRRDGALVMGRGCALEAQQKYPRLNYELGSKILKSGNKNYGVIVSDVYPEVGVFQVKHNYLDAAKIHIIRWSLRKLVDIAKDYELIALNFPGTGYGKLDRDVVLPHLLHLPPNVEVWEFANGRYR